HDLLVTLTITLPRFVVVFSPEYHQSGGRANAALTAPGLCEVTMPTANSIWIDITGLLAILLLVAANGFFVAAEFSLVAQPGDTTRGRGTTSRPGAQENHRPS